MNQPTLVLVRHGNTFERGQKSFWVGARTDLPLTVEGEQQAQNGILYITQKYPWIASIVAGPLKRTTSAAAIMGAHVDLPYTVDHRLCEIDYGKWEGRSNAEITLHYGSAELDAWDENSVWPTNMDWSPDLATILVTLEGFLKEQHETLSHAEKPVSHVAITSNGLLRLIYGLVMGQTGPDAKVSTGGICSLVPMGKGWQITAWNQRPV